MIMIIIIMLIIISSDRCRFLWNKKNNKKQTPERRTLGKTSFQSANQS